MELSWWLLAASGLSGVLFFALLAVGILRGRRGRWLWRRGFAAAAARAAERFACGEIGAAAYRILRDDLRPF